MNDPTFSLLAAILGSLAILCGLAAWILDRRMEREARRRERATLARMFRDPARFCRFKP